MHLDTQDPDVCYINDVFDNFNFIQHINTPTHIKGHTLDILLTCSDSPVLSDVRSTNMHLNDHFLITFKASLDFQKNDSKTISFRDIKSVDTEKFCDEAKLDLNSVHDAFRG